MSGSTGLPDYVKQLDAFHAAADDELRACLARLPIRSGSRLLDLAAGDGYFARVLAESFDDISIVAADRNEAYRDLCRDRNRAADLSDRIEIIDLDATDMDIDDDSFDYVFCGYSFRSIPQHHAVLVQCRRVLRPGGHLILLEADGMNSWVLPLPAKLELTLKEAERRYFADRDQQHGWMFSRRCAELLAEHHFHLHFASAMSVDRVAPFDDATQSYLRCEFDRMLDAVADHKPDALVDARRYLGDAGDDAIVDRDAAYVSSLHVLFIAQPAS